MFNFSEQLENAREWNFSANAVRYLLSTMVSQIRATPEFKNPISATDTYLGRIGEKVNEELSRHGISGGYDIFYAKFYLETEGRRVYG